MVILCFTTTMCLNLFYSLHTTFVGCVCVVNIQTDLSASTSIRCCAWPCNDLHLFTRILYRKTLWLYYVTYLFLPPQCVLTYSTVYIPHSSLSVIPSLTFRQTSGPVHPSVAVHRPATIYIYLR